MSDYPSLDALDLKVYTATWCPDCTRLDRWLQASGLKYAKVNIEMVEGAAEKLERETGKRAIPFILVNDKAWVRGYHRELPQRFDPELFVRELQEAAPVQ
ncbi:MAG: glutaredoxin [Holophagaceae bacterium]|nr:glutaredoxin [Holophagaceae bacterium]